jgi:uncharacterized protein YqeY
MVSLAEQLTEDMKTSMRAGDSVRTGTIRLLRGSFKNEEIKLGHGLSEDEAQKVLVREAKQRRDSIEAYRSAGRRSGRLEENELAVIVGYLPQAMDEVELADVVTEVVAELGAKDMKQMGAVIGAVVKRVGARADGGTISRLVRERLAGDVS